MPSHKKFREPRAKIKKAQQFCMELYKLSNGIIKMHLNSNCFFSIQFSKSTPFEEHHLVITIDSKSLVCSLLPVNFIY